MKAAKKYGFDFIARTEDSVTVVVVCEIVNFNPWENSCFHLVRPSSWFLELFKMLPKIKVRFGFTHVKVGNCCRVYHCCSGYMYSTGWSPEKKNERGWQLCKPVVG